ncbi:hypothetical protein CEE37_03125 [candidate division LCP-89 bacterium B3_LCP]|uniref:Secretion system C-terminal sorting domain-containing protein n=1 Tax=candidate division LCP-89 bacterium B3_LCP TaxID=2012998 RepID=A0A532V367_UNCL8|nr:MAG: hypothetical protein CEE37_03125 [candidate division LCP-89 bacterium B3_LCP]
MINHEEKNMVRIVMSLMLSLLIAFAAFANHADVAPTAGPVTTFPPTDNSWDMVFYTNAGVTCADNQLLGCAFADEWFFITGGGNAADPNYVYVLNIDGTFNFSFTQSVGSTGWGWRDLAWDGNYLYGSVTTTVEAFDTAGNLVTTMNINGPSLPNRALAYDPGSDTFWTQSFSGPIYNFDRSGAVLYTGSSGVTAAYGMAWDDESSMLWIYSQDGSPATTLYEYDPVGHALTGFAYTVPMVPGSTDQIAGGCSFTTEYDPLIPGGHIVGMTQGTPDDMLYVLEDPEATTPVELSAFNANVVEDGVMLTWTTQSEIDCYEWTVLRNGDAVSTLPGNGTTVEVHNYSYLDVVGSGTYTYQLMETDISGATTYSDELTVTVGSVYVTEYNLNANYPNPFNPTTNISFALPNDGVVGLSVYDISGSLVATLVDGFRSAGSYEVTFDATGLTSGVYFYQLNAGDYSSMHKMVLMK